MTPRIALCATLALLGVAAEALVAACSTSNCTETLTCGDAGPREGGADATVDASSDAGSDAGTDGATDAMDAADAPGCACIPAVPAGFQGPVAFVEEVAPDAGKAPAPPPCGAPYNFEVVSGFNDPMASAASCSCECGPVTGATCSAVTVQTFSDNTCHNQCGSVFAGTCTASQCTQNTQSAIASVPSPAGGSCEAFVAKGLPTWDPAQDWGVAGRVCASTEAGAPDGGDAGDGGSDASGPADSGEGGLAVPEGGEGGSPVADSGGPDGADGSFPGADSGCAGTEVCAPFSPFESSLCVWQSGVVACPTSYPNQHLLYASGTDSRSCSTGDCGCPAPTGASCSVTAFISTSAKCSGAVVLVGDAGSCVEYSPLTNPSYVGATVTHDAGSCTPSGSTTPNGQVTPTGATTVCCGN